MEDVGFLKKFDNLGRIVIPKELRDRYELNSIAEVIATKDGILLRNPQYVLVKKENSK